MNLIMTLKRLCDILFFLTFASFISVFSGGDNLLGLFFLSIVALILSIFLAGRGKLRFLSVLPFAIVLTEFSYFWVLLPIILYFIVNLLKQKSAAAEINYREPFIWYLRIFLATALFSLLGQNSRALFTQSALIYGAIFFPTAIMLMRLARHEQQILQHRSYRLLNLTILGVLGAASLLLISPLALNVWNQIERFIVGNLIWQNILLLLNFLLVLLQRIFAFIEGFLSSEIPEIDEEEILRPMEEIQLSDEFPVSGDINTFLQVLGGILIGIALFLLIKFLISYISTAKKEDDGEVTKDEVVLLKDVKKAHRQMRKFTADNAIREIYGKFLLSCSKYGIPVTSHMTSLDVEKAVSEKYATGKSQELRELYLKVRYGEKDFTKDEIKQAKAALRELGQTFKNERDDARK